MAKYRESGAVPIQSPTSANKIPFAPSQRMSDKMNDGQKEGVRVWNLMRQTLIDSGLMEEK